MSADSEAPAVAIDAMKQRGIDNPTELLAFASPAAILAACRWFDGRRRSVGPGALAKVIREGGMPEPSKHGPLHDQGEYLEQISDWIAEKMPDLCGCSPKVVECERRVYGDTLADKMAHSSEPHYAALAAVIRLHSRHGRGSLTVREHGPVIRAAVKESDRQAIEDYGAILRRREATAGIEGEGAR